MWCSGSYSWPLLERSQVQIPLRVFVFFLILARRGLYEGMGMGFCGEEGMTEEKRRTRNGNGGRTRNGILLLQS